MYSREIEQRKQSLKLSDLQRQTLVGVLMGDAHLETQNRGRTYRVKFEYSVGHEDYALHLYEIFHEWVLTPPQRKTDGSHNNVWFQTVSHEAFRYYAHQFYDEKGKRIPPNIHRFMNPRALAYWFMDDGSFKSSQSNGILFNTHCFARNEVQRLAEVLRTKFALEASVRSQRDGCQIYVSGKSYERFREIVDQHIHPSMRYKVPVDRIT